MKMSISELARLASLPLSKETVDAMTARVKARQVKEEAAAVAEQAAYRAFLNFTFTI